MSSEWFEYTVSDIAAPVKNALVGGPFGSNLVSKDYKESGVPVIRGQNMGRGRWVTGEFAFVSEEKAESLAANTARPGDIVFTQRGTLGQVAIVPHGAYEKYIVSQSQMKLTADANKADVLFLYYLFTSPEQLRYIQTNSIQVGVPHTNLGILRDTPISLPDLDTQKVISQLLSSLDDKIELNRQINKTLEQIAQALFKSWFVDFEPIKAKIEAKQNGHDLERAAMHAISGKTDQQNLDWYQQLAATAALFPFELEDSELGEIPIGWKVKKIEECIKRFPVGKKFSQKTASDYGAVPILDQGKSGIIGYHNEKPGVLATPDDPIIVFANHTCHMRIIMHDFSTIQNVIPFKGVDRNIYWMFMSTYGKQSFDEYKGHWPDFVIKQIVEPNNALDKIYGDQVADLFKMIYQNEKENITLSETRDSLLPKLLTGEISLGDTQSTAEAVA